MDGIQFGAVMMLAGLAVAGVAQAQSAGPGASYWVTADTLAGGLAPGAASAAAHQLTLQLAVRGAPDGPSVAAHLPPAGLGAGKSLPLVAPPQGPRVTDGGEPGPAGGRILVFWGCGEGARTTQPLVIDPARPRSGAAGLGGSLGQLGGGEPSPGAGRIYGEWPNRRGGTLGPRASLVGDHQVTSNFAPEIRFSLGAGDDFLPTVRLDGTAPAADGVVRVRWGAVAGARAYFLSVAGANEAGDTVIWTSSETPLIAGQIPDHLAANDLRRLVANKVLLPAATSACSVPVAVTRASPVGVLRIVAFGGDREIVSPARPANAKSDWRPDYLVRLRYASSATAMLGMDEPQDPEADPQDSSEMGEAGPGALGKGAGALLKSLGGLRR